MAVPSGPGRCFECRLDPASCEKQLDEYKSYRNAVLFKYKPYKCTTDSDCGFYQDMNECRAPTCGWLIDGASRALVDKELNAFARMSCNPGCPGEPVPPCVPEPAPRCFVGYCE